VFDGINLLRRIADYRGIKECEVPNEKG